LINLYANSQALYVVLVLDAVNKFKIL